MSPLLRVDRLTKTFGGVVAVEDVDLVVDRGEVVALVGDNAAGKSTIARVLGGVHRADAGQVLLDGQAVAPATPRAATELGIASVFQANQLVDTLDVVENLFLGQELRTRARVLDKVRMEQLARQYLASLGARIPDLHVPLAHLTAGQRQCVAIARTLVSEPRVVVLDEPTAALSVSQTGLVLEYVGSLRERGLGVVLISHNLADVRAVADRVVVLRHGRTNGVFAAGQASYEQLVAAITGAARF